MPDRNSYVICKTVLSLLLSSVSSDIIINEFWLNKLINRQCQIIISLATARLYRPSIEGDLYPVASQVKIVWTLRDGERHCRSTNPEARSGLPAQIAMQASPVARKPNYQPPSILGSRHTVRMEHAV
jgi:hypothetical protein